MTVRLIIGYSRNLFYVIHKGRKTGMKVIDALSRVIASRLKGQEDALRETDNTGNSKLIETYYER